MGASSIYRHIRSKEELLVEELAELQEQAWRDFRTESPRHAPALERLRAFLDAQHALLARDRDWTTIALRAATHPEARAARRSLALDDRTVGLVYEILQNGRVRGELAPDVDLLAAARTLVPLASGLRVSWANGLLDADACRDATHSGLDLLFRGIGR